MPRSDESSSRSSFDIPLILLDATEANHSPQIDTDKLAQLAGFSNGKSANASWLVIKKKLLNGATVDAATAATNPKKGKGKAATNGDADVDDEATPAKAAPKQRSKAIKKEPVDAEGGDADTEVTPSAESPKKGRTKKATAPANTDTVGDATNGAAATEVITQTPKRKRGPNKPKDPNATRNKRAKKGANAAATTSTDDAIENDAANTQLHGDEAAAQSKGESSLFGADANAKKEEEEGDDRSFNADEQKMADATLFDIYTTEGQLA